MERIVSAFDARRSFGEILQEVAANGDNVVVERHGKPVAVVVPMHVYQQWQRSREAFFEKIRQAAERSDMSPEDGEALVEAAIQDVRARKSR